MRRTLRSELRPKQTIILLRCLLPFRQPVYHCTNTKYERIENELQNEEQIAQKKNERNLVDFGEQHGANEALEEDHGYAKVEHGERHGSGVLLNVW